MKLGIFAILVALAGCATPTLTDTLPALPSRIEKFDCEVRVAIVFVPADDERWSHLPDGFAPYALGETGGPLDSTRRVASVSLLVYDCARGTIDGAPFGPSTVVEWATGVVPPDQMRRAEAAHEHAIGRLWSDEPTEAGGLAAWGIGGAGDIAWQGGAAFELAATGGPTRASWRGATGDRGPGEEDPRGAERHFAIAERAVVGWIDVDLNVTASGVGSSVVELDGSEPLFATGGPRAATLTLSAVPPPACECATIAWSWAPWEARE